MKRKTNQQNGNEPLSTADLRPTVRLLVLLAFLKLAVIIGLSVVVSQLQTTVGKQGKTIDAQAQAIARTDETVQRVTSDEATRAQQIVLYKIFLAQCEGRQLTNPTAFASTGDKDVTSCANRLFLAQPQLPANEFIVPDVNND